MSTVTREVTAALLIRAATKEEAEQKASGWAGAVSVPDAESGIVSLSLKVPPVGANAAGSAFAVPIVGELTYENSPGVKERMDRWRSRLLLEAARRGVQVTSFN